MRGVFRRPLSVAVVAGVAVLVIGTSVVIGANVATNGGPVTAVRTKTATDVVTITSVVQTDIPGMSLGVDVPVGQTGMFVITFSAETSCSGITSNGICYVRVLLDGVAARPGPVIFGSHDAPVNNPYEVKSMQFVAGPAGPGTHYVRVQYYTTGAYTQLGFGLRTLTVLRSQG